MNHQLINALTIDVEDYFQVANFIKVIDFSAWDSYQCRVEGNTLHVLKVLNEFKVKATFFILGWVAERYPKLIENIHHEGHEIASHGYRHQFIGSQTKKKFRMDVRKTKKILEDITGEDIIGFRAPSFSMTPKSYWALEILIEEGFKYDSSILPIRRFYTKISCIPRFPFIINGSANKQPDNHSWHLPIRRPTLTKKGGIIEFPVSTIRLFGNNFPIAGGGYFRLFPYQFTKWGFNIINRKEKKPCIFYIHPWEFDVDQPHIKGASSLSKFRHYINLDKTEDKLKRLLSDFKFSTVKDILGIQSQSASSQAQLRKF